MTTSGTTRMRVGKINDCRFQNKHSSNPPPPLHKGGGFDFAKIDGNGGGAKWRGLSKNGGGGVAI